MVWLRQFRSLGHGAKLSRKVYPIIAIIGNKDAHIIGLIFLYFAQVRTNIGKQQCLQNLGGIAKSMT
jgi:hypothetical protein